MHNLVRYKPWNTWGNFQNQLNQLLETNFIDRSSDVSKISTSQWCPHVDIKEEKDKYTIFADIPGVDPKDISVSLEDNVLTIHGERQIENRDEQNDYSRIERFSGTFYRRFTLPDNVDSTKVEAKGKHGVLIINIPKKESNIPKKIKVDVANDS